MTKKFPLLLLHVLYLSVIFLVFPGGLVLAQSEATPTGAKVGNESSDTPSVPTSVPMISTAVLSGEAVFAYNSYVLSNESIQVLNKLIRDLDDFASVESIKVIGHTDDRGSDKYNLQLSEHRARYIAQFFARRFPSLKVSALGAGESSPIASNATAEGRERNRRVEIQVIAKGLHKP
ncbi:MAG: OmpA family protein [Granulosicoccus sp.]|nr:OmpA family protein [Granulosicoccus sp.]